MGGTGQRCPQRPGETWLQGRTTSQVFPSRLFLSGSSLAFWVKNKTKQNTTAPPSRAEANGSAPGRGGWRCFCPRAQVAGGCRETNPTPPPGPTPTTANKRGQGEPPRLPQPGRRLLPAGAAAGGSPIRSLSPWCLGGEGWVSPRSGALFECPAPKQPGRPARPCPAPALPSAQSRERPSGRALLPQRLGGAGRLEGGEGAPAPPVRLTRTPSPPTRTPVPAAGGGGSGGLSGRRPRAASALCKHRRGARRYLSGRG